MAKKAQKKKPKKTRSPKKKAKKKQARKPARRALPARKKTVKKQKPPKKKKATIVKKKVLKKPVRKQPPKQAKAQPVKPVVQKPEPKPVPVQPVAKPQPRVIKAPEVKKSDSSQSVSPPPPALPRKVIRTTFSSSSLKDKKREVHPNEYSFEYVMHASPALLFEMISTPSGLSEWFANDVNIRDGNFTFFWDGSEQVAKQIAYKDQKLVRFRWLDKPEYTFFEFRIEVDELTNESSLIITDFAEDGDKESARMLWDNEIAKLKKAIGS